MKKILITGKTGFIGTNLSTYLSNHNYIINALSTKKQSSDDYSYEDLDQCFINKFEAIIHLAGKAHDVKNKINPKQYYEVNTELTKILFDKFLLSPSKCFIFLSSVKAVTDHSNEEITELTVQNPQTHYGKSKLLAEQYILSKKIPEGKKVYILRPCMVHGPGNKGNLNLLFNIVKKKIPYPLGAYENRRSFLSVENLNFIIEKLIVNKSISSGVYNIADDQFISTKKIVEIIGEVLKIQPLILNLNPRLIKFVSKIGSFLNLPINEDNLQKLTENYIVSNAKIKQVLKTDLPILTEIGLEITIKSFNNSKL